MSIGHASSLHRRIGLFLHSYVCVCVCVAVWLWLLSEFVCVGMHSYLLSLCVIVYAGDLQFVWEFVSFHMGVSFVLLPVCFRV